MTKRVLLSTIGSRGDAQPLVALALAVRAAGLEVRLCVPPDFRAWCEGLGLEVVPIGPELRGTAKPPPPGAAPPTPAQFEALAAGTVATQFATLGEAARGCDAIVGATALQVAAPSVAEALGVPYVFAAYCPAVLPSPRHAPPLLTWLGDEAVRAADYGARWPLPPELEAFLAAGPPPVYVGFGSIRAPDGVDRAAIEAVRALGRRVIVSRGWAELGLVDDGPDGIAIDDVSHAALFPCVAAVVHHGGAGTTTAAARAGAPQVVVPQHYDQPYWAQRVESLGVGAAHALVPPTAASLAALCERALDAGVAARAREVAAKVRLDGAERAAAQLAQLLT